MSLEMQVLSLYFRLTAKRLWSDAERMREHARQPKDDPQPPKSVRSRHRIEERQVNGFRTFTVRPRERPRPGAVLYVHGGGYVSEISPWHWRFISKLAAAGVTVEVPIYGLAPTYTFEDAYPYLTQVYRELLDEHDARTVTFMGDSAGGGLARSNRRPGLGGRVTPLGGVAGLQDQRGWWVAGLQDQRGGRTASARVDRPRQRQRAVARP